MTVTTLDRERLEPGEFLNDNVIDFHFKCVHVGLFFFFWSALTD